MQQGQRNLQCQWLGKVHWTSDHTHTCQTRFPGFHGFPTMGDPKITQHVSFVWNDKSVKWMISGYIKFRKHPYGSGWFFASQNPSIDWHHMRFCDAIWVQIQAATIGLQISYPYNQATSYLCCKSLLAFAAPHLFTRAALEVFAQLCLDPVDPMIFSKGWAGHPAVYIGKIVSIDKCGIWYCVISFFTRVCY